MQRPDDEQLDRLFAALSSRVRRAMLQRLQEGPATAGELAEPHAISLPAVSKHLKTLERAGLIQRTVSGRVHHCRLDHTGLSPAAQWLETYRGFWNDTLEALETHVSTKGQRRKKSS